MKTLPSIWLVKTNPQSSNQSKFIRSKIALPYQNPIRKEKVVVLEETNSVKKSPMRD